MRPRKKESTAARLASPLWVSPRLHRAKACGRHHSFEAHAWALESSFGCHPENCHWQVLNNPKSNAGSKTPLLVRSFGPSISFSDFFKMEIVLIGKARYAPLALSDLGESAKPSSDFSPAFGTITCITLAVVAYSFVLSFNGSRGIRPKNKLGELSAKPLRKIETARRK